MYYLINTVDKKIVFKDENSSRVNYVQTDSYGPGPDWKDYSVMSEDQAFEYWSDVFESSGEAYEGLGCSEDRKHEIFNDWLEG
jgi:hypothetical protein